MSTVRYGLIAAALAASAWLPAGSAEPQLRALRSSEPAPQPAAPRDAQPLGEADLAEAAGGQAIAITDQQLTALNTGNSVNAGTVTNGPVTISPNAFSGFSGLGNFVINTGNNNNLQGTMSLNIVITPAP